MKRTFAARLGNETVAVLNAGAYTAPSGKVVAIAEPLRRAVSGTVTYPPGHMPPRFEAAGRETCIEVVNETTLAVAGRMARAGERPAALNFASAKHPGGGFLGGALAQEESLARSSGLYACLVGNEMYAYHAGRGDAIYSDYVIYSPDVPVIREDEGALLEEPFLCSFITSPAVNARVVLQRDPRRRPEVREAMRGRVRKVLAVAAGRGHASLVLGAWGCGVFGNDGHEIADLFRQALLGPFAGAFGHAVFAVVDWSEEERFIGPFRAAFA